MFVDLFGNHVYESSDGRLRCYNPNTLQICSYPRVLMEHYLGRSLEPYEDVHHIDENPMNNDISNLEIIIHGEHQRLHSLKYFDKVMVCPNCGKEFIWTGKQLRNFYSNQNRHKNVHLIGFPFCSKSCIGSYSRQEQLARNCQAECQ